MNPEFYPADRPDTPYQVAEAANYSEWIVDPAEILPSLVTPMEGPSEDEIPAVDVWQTGVVQDVLHAKMLAEASWIRSMGMVLKSVRGHYKEAETAPEKAIMASRIGSVALTQFVDRSRWMFLVVPNVATKVYENSHNSIKAGLAAAGVFAVWSLIVGETLGRNARKLPRTINTVVRAFPGFSSFFTENLPGLNQTDKKEKSVFKNQIHEHVDKISNEISTSKNLPVKERIKTIGKSLIKDGIKPFGTAIKAGAKNIISSTNTHLQRGLTGLGLGSTAYVASALAKNRNHRETSKAGALVTLDTSGLIALFGTGITSGLDQLARHGHPDIAVWIDDWIVSNNKFWTTIGFGTIYANYLINKKSQGENKMHLLPPKFVSEKASEKNKFRSLLNRQQQKSVSN